MKYTKYEKARIIGSRALQLSMGAPFMLKLSHEELEKLRYDTIEIAKLEFEKGVIPITVKREYPHSKNKKTEKKKIIKLEKEKHNSQINMAL